MMSRASLLLILPVSCATLGSTGPELPPGDACAVALDTAWWGGTFEAVPGAVRGAGLELRTEGDVLLGFVGGRKTRLHVSGERLDGSYAGQPADFKLTREEGRLVLRGTLGSLGLVTMRADPSRIDFSSGPITVELVRGDRGYRGTATRFDDVTHPTMQVRGCEAMFVEPVFLLAVVAPFVVD